MSLGYPVMLKLSALEVALLIFLPTFALRVEIQSFVSIRAGEEGGPGGPHRSPLYWLRNCCAQSICHICEILLFYLYSMEDVVVLCLGLLHHLKNHMVRGQKLGK
jgi:hypothetical protein